MRPAFISILLFFGVAANAVVIPVDLSRSDREEVVRLLGLATSTKLLTNPFPLGGYSGFEIGLAVELIDISNLPKLGCDVGAPGCPNTGEGDKELRYPRIHIGKGLYNNVDVFLNFVPQSTGSEMTSFGGAIRYSFYEAQFLPVNLSLVITGGHVNVNDQFEGVTLGADLVGGLYINQLAIYLGVGQLRSSGTFLAGDLTANPINKDVTVDENDPDVNGNTNTVKHRVNQVHTLAGASVHLDDVFLAAQIDRYPEPVYSFRLGLRF
jgi:hypothetical protein